MGRFFSDRVEQALQYIYYDMSSGRVVDGSRGIVLLEEAVSMWDADAMFLLARCISGKRFSWPGHLFEEDWDRALKLYKESIVNGSSLGMLKKGKVDELVSFSIMLRLVFCCT